MYLFTEYPFVNISFETIGTEMEVKAGVGIFHMDASYQSYPDANISWYKDGKPIDAADIRYQIRYSKV